MPSDEFDYSSLPIEFALEDHLGGFDSHYRNAVLDKISQASNKQHTIHYHNLLDPRAKQNYPALNIKFSSELQDRKNFAIFENAQLAHTKQGFDHFLCCFSGSEHLSRQFLVSALHKFGWFNHKSCTKNFKTFVDRVDGNLASFFDDPEQERFYRKFVITESEEFCNLVHGLAYNRFDHVSNLSTLYSVASNSFVQIVSETLATSSCMFVTEKVMYPILSKVLFLTYGQANYHSHLETYYGFKKYSKIFDYGFDSIANPVIRLVTMLAMLAKFEKLSVADLHDLYLLEQDTIEYNYNWYRSKKYLDELKKYE